MRPSMNEWYHVPMGSDFRYGDQAVEMLHLLVKGSGLKPEDLQKCFFVRCGGAYEPLGNHGGLRWVRSIVFSMGFFAGSVRPVLFLIQVSNFNWPGLRLDGSVGPSPGKLKFEICKRRKESPENNLKLIRNRLK